MKLASTTEQTRIRCNVCGLAVAGADGGYPCPRCHGSLAQWSDRDVEQNRSVRRIRSGAVIPLEAGEHTAQINNDAPLELEERFKAPPSVSKVNVLACSPTLELGIDVGGLDAVVLQTYPPRPDNYAQRGGTGRTAHTSRACRRLLSKHTARSVFHDCPAEMISGEVPAPMLALGNRDVLTRHLNAIVFGAAEPGLAGRMVEVRVANRSINEEVLDLLKEALREKTDAALQLAREAWSEDVLPASGLDDASLRARLVELPERVQDVIVSGTITTGHGTSTAPRSVCC